VTRTRRMRIGGKLCDDGVLMFHRRQGTTTLIMRSVKWKFGNSTTVGVGSPAIDKPSRSDQLMLAGCVVRKLA
jgi:hypothetical protein